MGLVSKFVMHSFCVASQLLREPTSGATSMVKARDDHQLGLGGVVDDGIGELPKDDVAEFGPDRGEAVRRATRLCDRIVNGSGELKSQPRGPCLVPGLRIENLATSFRANHDLHQRSPLNSSARTSSHEVLDAGSAT